MEETTFHWHVFAMLKTKVLTFEEAIHRVFFPHDGKEPVTRPTLFVYACNLSRIMTHRHVTDDRAVLDYDWLTITKTERQ